MPIYVILYFHKIQQNEFVLSYVKVTLFLAESDNVYFKALRFDFCLCPDKAIHM